MSFFIQPRALVNIRKRKAKKQLASGSLVENKYDRSVRHRFFVYLFLRERKIEF